MPEAESAAKAAEEPKKSPKTDQNEKYSLRVKKEFLLDKRPPSLGDLPPEIVPEGGGNKKNKKQKSKKRPRDQRVPNSEKLCLAMLKGDGCPFGEETCKFSHDIKEFLKTRLDDITTVEGGCPNFNEKGFCVFGAMCRVGSSHLIKATGESMRKEGVVAPPPIQNILPKEILIQLRKRKYPFKCQYRKKERNDRFLKNQQDNNSNKDETKESKKEEDKSKADKSPENAKKESEQSPNSGQKTEGGKAENDKSPIKPIFDPFRPKMTEEKANSTPFPAKTKKIIDFSNKVYVAPLTTVGNLPFRRIMKKFGADITCGEMAVAGNLLEGKPSEWALLKRHPCEDVFGIQIASGYPDQFTRIAEVIESHCDVDFVDMNLGCPLDIICQKGAGASLMLRANNLKGILSGVTSALSCPVTVKMRTGWESEKPFAHQLVAKIQSWGFDGVAAVMVHGRSRLQRYSNNADWDYISKVSLSQDDSAPKIPVIGNGDIFSYTDYEEKIAREGISSTAMLARGALIKPWLPTEIKEKRHWDISASERLDLLKDFVKFGLTHWGSDQQGVDNTRRFLLEWLSFLYRYVPVGIVEGGWVQQMNQRPPPHMCGRSDLETLFLSAHSHDWVKIAEMLLGPVPDGFRFEPKHKARGYQ
ncbi:synthase [Seminavis robusta]|uniref:tRNA-dihydrouridine(47) synthase [NAD(P)(+)] n=1 Tax=Seminavis robusta TaxID=568900 RepID=A0A9N8HMS2_9STRA|nr:synthase [Seminavis robusta]|eukprot:Sro767_g199550.1 synthase (643) ;mRNA; f:43171-45190